MKEQSAIRLSREQLTFMEKALSGCHILVDACIGSGKTTAIQHLCRAYPPTKRILYLTYNRLLKQDAKGKIKQKNVTVTNYHGFAYGKLKGADIQTGVEDSVIRFNEVKPEIQPYDVLIIDEYQDIEQAFAEMLEYIKSVNPKMQIIAVGDMDQKIYDKTALDVPSFIEQFLGNHVRLTFTTCFRLSSGLAGKLGRIWGKEIRGVNGDCVVETMNRQEAVAFLATQETRDVLCLGARGGAAADALNELERRFPEKYNKKTTYATISNDESWGRTTINKSTAIFTTFDGSKGMERNVCVIFDFTESYWTERIRKPQQKYAILRNVFCVAASRGKQHIIFVSDGEPLLSEETLSTPAEATVDFEGTVNMAEMFDHKYQEDIEACYRLLDCSPLDAEDRTVIDIEPTDGLIDLSPCIGTYQEAVFFPQDQYDIGREIALYHLTHKGADKSVNIDSLSLEEKVLYLTSLETRHERYRKQVRTPFIGDGHKASIIRRLSSRFTGAETVQAECSITFCEEKTGRECFTAVGLCDVLKDDIVYELKFVGELSHKHFLQCACYMVALHKDTGVLWNTRDNTQFTIRIPDKGRFLDAVARAVTKRRLEKYRGPALR